MLAPIFALWFGLGIWSKVALGFTLVFFIVFFNVYQGVREVSPPILANARMLGMNERQLFRHVYWPSALTWMFSSLHTSVGFALVGAVVGEYLGSSAGLGYKIQQAEGVFDVTGVFSGMLILRSSCIVIDALVTMVEKRLLGLAAGQGPQTARVDVGADQRRESGKAHGGSIMKRSTFLTRPLPRRWPRRSARRRWRRRRRSQGRRSASAASRCSTISR